LILSIVVSAAVAFLILGPRPQGVEGAMDVSALPTVNASLNALTALLLVVGLVFIKQQKIAWHKNTMMTAFGTSSAFLVTYVIYHWFKAGPARYTGDFTVFYRVILVSHILLAAIIIPLALVTLYLGYTSQLPKHRRLARITLPVWLYVSVTGVVIYAMLYL
jgi:putative membrane protein